MQSVGPDPEVGGCDWAGTQYKRCERGQWLASTARYGGAAVHELESNLSPSALMINLSYATLPEPPHLHLHPPVKPLSGRQANNTRVKGKLIPNLKAFIPNSKRLSVVNHRTQLKEKDERQWLQHNNNSGVQGHKSKKVVFEKWWSWAKMVDTQTHTHATC